MPLLAVRDPVEVLWAFVLDTIKNGGRPLYASGFAQGGGTGSVLRTMKEAGGSVLHVIL